MYKADVVIDLWKQTILQFLKPMRRGMAEGTLLIHSLYLCVQISTDVNDRDRVMYVCPSYLMACVR